MAGARGLHVALRVNATLFLNRGFVAFDGQVPQAGRRKSALGRTFPVAAASRLVATLPCTSTLSPTTLTARLSPDR